MRMSRSGCRVRSAGRTAQRWPGRGRRGGPATTSHIAEIAPGCTHGVQSRSRTGSSSTSPMMNPCASRPSAPSSNGRPGSRCWYTYPARTGPPQAHDQERPGPGRLRRDHDEERAGEHDVDPARETGPLADLEPRKERSAHAQYKVETGIPVFFADPQSPWQRGTNENTNGLCVSTSPRAPTYPDGPPTSSTLSAHRTEHQAPQEARLEDGRCGFGSAIHGRPRAAYTAVRMQAVTRRRGDRVVAGLAPEGGEVDGGDRCVLGIAGVHGPLISGDRGASAARSNAAGP